MSEGSFGGDLRGGVVWSTLALIGSKAFTFAATVVLARLLVPADFGVLAALVIFLGFLDLGADLGMGATVVYEQERGITNRVHTAFTVNLAVIVVLTGVAVAVSPLVADFFRVPEHTDLFRLGSLSLLFTGLGNVADKVLLRDMDFRRRTLAQVARAGVRGIVAIVLALAGVGVASLVVGMLAGAAVSTVLQWALSGFRPRLRFDLAEARSMFGYGSGAVGLELVSIVSVRMDQIAIGRILTERALGLYTVAFRVPELLIDSLTWNVSLVAFPAMAREHRRESGSLGAGMLKLVRFQAIFALPLAAGLAVAGPQLIVVLFSAKWTAAGPVLSAVALVSGITAVVFPLGDVFKALGRQRILIGMSLTQMPLLLVAMLLAAPAGIVTVAWVRVVSIALYGAVMIAFAAPLVHVRFREVGRALVPGSAAALAVAGGAGLVRLAWGAPEIVPLALQGMAGAACGLAALRLLAPDDLERLVRLLPARARPRSPAPEAP